MNRVFHYAVLLAGLACIAWVGAGYAAGGLALPLAVTVLIGAFFLLGALELQRLRQSTDALARALAGTTAAPPALGPWLDALPPALRPAVRLRIEGQRVALPGPALVPYLAGFLVLLGMLGTFLGMVVTLRGTGAALQGAADLAGMRAALAAPVSGLGVAFGTSLAGVAASATLGLAMALARRERLLAGQQLDLLAAGVLRPFSEAHRRDASHRLLQQQAEAVPRLVDGLQQLMQGLERQHAALHAQLRESQQEFHARTEAAYTSLAGAVDRSLKDSLAESARLAGAAIQPAVEATMAGVAREAAALHAGAAQGVQQQLDAAAQRFAASAEGVSQAWTAALAEQRATQAHADQQLRGTLDGFASGFAQRSAALVEQVSGQLAGTTAGLADRWQAALAEHARTSQAEAAGTRQALADNARQFADQAAALLRGVEQAHAELQARMDARDAQRQADWAEALARQEHAHQAAAGDARQALAATAAGFAQQAAELQRSAAQAHDALQAAAAAHDAQRLAAWTEALARHEQAAQSLAGDARAALEASAAGFAEHTAALQRGVQQAHAELLERGDARDAERLAAWTGRLDALADALRTQWQQASAHALEQQQRICATLAETAQAMAARAEQQAGATVAEVARLVEAAAAAPRAAAEVIAELRDKLTASMARDNAMLDERARVLETLGALLDGVQHAASAQRSAIDALVDSAAGMLERAGSRFAQQAEAEGGRIAEASAQVAAGAAEVASLGEAFGAAVQLFGQSSERIGTHLQQLEDTLARSIARSDEQLAYYVAQAREVIDLSLLSQKQIMEDLQRLARERAAELAEGNPA
ncbi:DUF802 domain-containing protein [Pseudorhodoferax sp.]|uniref:DUF802 domain-containing protein n=1 Tax=Pseudorhodoferax sp. TaxID=1993553 RepID=UPI0039E6FD7A